MTSTSLLEFTVAIIPVFLMAYAAYWALSIRRALGVRVYRRQALGVFLVGVTLSCYVIAFSLYNWLGLQSGLDTALEVFFSFGAPPLVTFYWLDSSIMTAKRSDPLQREVFWWEKIRRVLWVWVIVAFVLLVSSFVGTAIGVILPSSGPLFDSVFLFILSPVFLVAISGLVVLRRAATFAEDARFARHVLWFGLFLFLVLIPLVSIFIPNLYVPSTPLLVQVLVFAVPQSVGGYCLYKSARTLAPLREPTIVMGAR